MATEIERKFIVNKKSWDKIEKPKGLSCVQAYLVNEVEKTIRIRIMDQRAFLTIKGKTIAVSRTEFEYEIPLNEGKEILDQFGDLPLIKTRYLIPIENHTWEVDVFEGENEGLIIAEIELKTEDEEFLSPEWIGEEVSHDSRYYNACLQKHPYKNW